MNTQINEDYVSFEIAKLLKEKGFNIPCDYAYNNKAGYFEVDRSNFDEVYCFRPSLAMAMKWLREEYKIHIRLINSTEGDYHFEIYWNRGNYFIANWYHKTYEEACEAAIKYCLTNLI